MVRWGEVCWRQQPGTDWISSPCSGMLPFHVTPSALEIQSAHIIRPSAFCHFAASSGKDLVSQVPWNQDKRLDSSSMMIRNERKYFQTKSGHFMVKPL